MGFFKVITSKSGIDEKENVLYHSLYSLKNQNQQTKTKKTPLIDGYILW